MNTRFYVYAQYSRHIRPGSTIVDGGNPSTITAYDEKKQRLTLVTVNNGNPDMVPGDSTSRDATFRKRHLRP